MIVVSSLGKSYGDNTILSNINLSFEKGKINGLVGENGEQDIGRVNGN